MSDIARVKQKAVKDCTTIISVSFKQKGADNGK